MKKTLITLALLCTAGLASAQTWRFLPLLNDPNHKLEPTLALTGGNVKPVRGSDSSNLGLELSFNCGLVQSPDNRIRSYLQINQSDERGVKATAFELSPRYMLPVAQGLSVGAGPSLTAVRVKAPGVSQTVYGAGVAAGLDWRSGRLYAGVDLRWHDTSPKDGVQFDSTAVGLKLGFNF